MRDEIENEEALKDHWDKMLKIYNGGSSLGAYYHLQLPFQIVLESCTGIEEGDYGNILVINSRAQHFDTRPINYFLSFFSAVSLHQHDFLEIMLVLKGEIIHKIEDKEYLYPAGTCCLINRNLRHQEKFIGETQVFFLGLSVKLAQELLDSCQSSYFDEEQIFSESPTYQFLQSDIHNSEKKEYLDFFPVLQNQSSYTELHRLADLIMQTALFPKFGATYILKGLFCTLLQYISSEELYHITDVKLDSSADFLLFARIGHLLEDADGRLSRQELASRLNYSGDYLNRIVRKYAGLSLYDYGMTFCLKKARTLLATTDEPVSSIAARLHFSNRTHFYKLFKDKYHLTPREYRLQANSHKL